MNEIMWKGKKYSGMTVENGIIINDGDEVISGSDSTVNVQKMGGYRDLLGDQGRRFICQGNLTLMGQIPVEERINTKKNWAYSLDNENWTDIEDLGIEDAQYIGNLYDLIFFKNLFENGQVKGIINDEYKTWSGNAGKWYKYKANEILFTKEINSLINFIKPTDLYSRIYLPCSGTPNIETISAINFSSRTENNTVGSMQIKIIGADLNNYQINIFYQNTHEYEIHFNLGTFKIPRSSNTIGLFSYCTEWGENAVQLGIGIAGFNITDETHYQLTAFFPIGDFYYGGDVFGWDGWSNNSLQTIIPLNQSPKKYAWQTYYKTAKNSNNKAYFNINDGQFYANYDEETSTFSNQIPGQAGGTVFLDLLTNNYYMCSSYTWYLLYVTSTDDSYVYSPVNNVNEGWWTQISPSPEYEYAAQITQRYNYIDRATYNSLAPSDSNG